MNHSRRKASGFALLATLVLAGLILKAGQAIIVPLAVAFLLALLLSPVAASLQRLGLGRILSVFLTSAFAFTVLAGIGWMVMAQTWDLLKELPNYEKNFDAKVQKLSVLHKSADFTRLAEMTARFEKRLLAPSIGLVADGSTPVPVEVETPPTVPFTVLQQLVTPALVPIGTAGIVVIFVVAILLQRHDLRDRLTRLAAPERARLVKEVLDDAEHRICRYLAAQLVVNACLGAFVGLGLHFLGIPNAALWGLVAMLLRFIPYLGPWLAAACPLLVALAIEPGWFAFFATLGLYVIAETVTANAIEPVAYGARTGVSGLALLFAAVFWSWLWGLPGLFLSTPLTVCLMVVGKDIPEMKFLGVLLGGPPAEEK